MLSVLRITKPICFGCKTPNNSSFAKLMRSYSETRDGKSGARKTIIEALRKPGVYVRMPAGRGAALTGAALLGMGAICFYGVKMGSDANQTNLSKVWPQYVIDRVRTNFAYLGSSVAITAAISVIMYRNITSLGVISKTSGVALLTPLIILNLIKFVANKLPKSERNGAELAIWAGHHVFIAAIIASVCYAGGPLIINAALHAAIVTTSFTTVAACASSDKFLNIAGPLSMVLGALIASTLVHVSLAHTITTVRRNKIRMFGVPIYSLALYGGLLLVSGFMLYNTQRLVEKAHSDHYDPINTSLSLSVNTANLILLPLIAASSLTSVT